MTPLRIWRGLLLWLHITSSVTWMSQALAMLVLLTLSATSPPGETKVAAAEMAEVLDAGVLALAALVAAFTGFGLAAVTTWGYFQHWWVSTKFVLTLVQLTVGTLVIGLAMPEVIAAAEAGTDGDVVPVAVLLGVSTAQMAFQVWLSVTKPWGRTARGRREQGRLTTAPVPVVATMVVAPLLDLGVSLLAGVPLPPFSLVGLTVALVVRRRRGRRTVGAGTAARTGAVPGVVPGTVVPGTVVRRTVVAPGVVSLHLARADGSPVPVWEPGAHVDLVLPSGTVRQYSLHGAPADRSGYDVAVLREPEGRGGSIEVHALEEGSAVGIGGPRNTFPLVDAPSYLFLAGGIGITALVPMIERAEAVGTPWQLVHRGRSRPAMAFADELAARYGDRVRLLPADTTPRPDLPALLGALPAGCAVYCCGPEALMDAVADAMATACPQGSLHLERFTATARDESGNRPFQVLLPQARTTVEVPADRSMLESLRDVLPDTPASCETGLCGSCELRVLGGRPEHRDDILAGADRERTDVIYPCVSRSRDPLLVLDA